MEFNLGDKVKIDECYLTDEVTENTETSPTATVVSKPSYEEELVMIQYDSGLLDYVPQNIIEKIS
jgi:hypothetical protein